MNHAMTAAQTEIFRFRDAPNREIALRDLTAVAAHIDDDWEEFLALGLQAESGDFSNSGQWRNAPVRLSF